MCRHSDSARAVGDAADALTMACRRRFLVSLRQFYNRVVDEPVPQRFLDILDGKLPKDQRRVRD